MGGTHFDDGNLNSPDPVERFSSRQDLILDPRFSLNLAIRLYEHNLPFELHVYDEGAHGIGLADDTNILKNTPVITSIHGSVFAVNGWMKNFPDKKDRVPNWQ